ERLRLAPGLRAPPRSWTLLDRLLGREALGSRAAGERSASLAPAMAGRLAPRDYASRPASAPPRGRGAQRFARACDGRAPRAERLRRAAGFGAASRPGAQRFARACDGRAPRAEGLRLAAGFGAASR